MTTASSPATPDYDFAIVGAGPRRACARRLARAPQRHAARIDRTDRCTRTGRERERSARDRRVARQPRAARHARVARRRDADRTYPRVAARPFRPHADRPRRARRRRARLCRTLRLARAGARGRRARHARRLAHVDHRARAAAGCRRRHADARRPAGRAQRCAHASSSMRKAGCSTNSRPTPANIAATTGRPRSSARSRYRRRARTSRGNASHTKARSRCCRSAGRATEYALVWCCTPDEAARRAALPDDAFLRELGRAFGERMGDFVAIAGRASFPLGLTAAPTLVNGRVAIVGNAAQTLHPVAGQGSTSGCAMRIRSSIHCPPKASRPPHSPPSTRAAHSTGASRSARPTRWRACSRSTQPAPAAARRGAHRAGVRTAAQEGDRATDDVRPAQLTRGAHSRAAQTGSNRRGMGIR